MEFPPGNPFREDHKIRKPGVAGLVGDVFGEKAKAAYEKRVGAEKNRQTAPVPQEDWEGADIEMSAGERAKIHEERVRFRLRDIPTFSTLPSAEDLKDEFALDLVSEEYESARTFRDFAQTDNDFEWLGLDGPAIQRMRESIRDAKESPPLAKIFDIGELIRLKRQADPKTPGPLVALSNKEVFEAIDAAGYRPATFEELLAYGRDYWKPIDPDDLTEEERLQHVDARIVVALGVAACGGEVGHRFYDFPALFRDDEHGPLNRSLEMLIPNDEWKDHFRFLVVRKASS